MLLIGIQCCLFPQMKKIMLYFKTGIFPDSWDTWSMEVDENGYEVSPPVMLESKVLEEGKMTLGPVRGKNDCD